MTNQIVFKVIYGPVDDFRIAPSPDTHINIRLIRNNAINSCVDAFRKELESILGGDESIIEWGPTHYKVAIND